MIDYLRSAADSDNAVVAFFFSVIVWLLFPEESFAIAFVAIFIAAGLDLITRYIALIKKTGSFFTAIRTGAISSKRMWEGLSVKIYSYLVVAILVGLAHRVLFIREASLFAGSFIYSMLFIREVQSVIENLVETGADLGWLAAFARRKERELMQKQGIEDEGKPEQQNDGASGTPTI